MLSETAIASLEELQAKGLTPSFRDVVRLNALGLRLEAARNKRVVKSTSLLPRVAQLSETVAFRQPSVGHEIWFDKMERLVLKDDVQTVLAVKAFALSRPWTDLPDPDDPKSVKVAIDTFCDEMKDYTRDQIYAALSYVLWGADPSTGEHGGQKPKREPDGTVLADWDHCVAVGVLNEGRAILWGCTAADMKSMTLEELRNLIERSYILHPSLAPCDDIEDAENDFFTALDEIESRLTKLATSH